MQATVGVSSVCRTALAAPGMKGHMITHWSGDCKVRRPVRKGGASGRSRRLFWLHEHDNQYVALHTAEVWDNIGDA